MTNKLFLLLSFGFGGAESRILKVANKTLGENDYICINSEFLDKAKSREDLNVVVTELIKKDKLIFLPKVPKMIKNRFGLHFLWVLFFGSLTIIRHRPRLFHSVLGGILLTFVAKICGSKTIVELTSPDNVKFCSNFSLFLVKFTDLFLAVSKSVEAKAKKEIPNIREIETYPIPYYESKNTKVNNTEDTGVITISFCARLIPRKNALLFSRAIKKLHSMRQDFIVNLMGDGPELNQVEAILKDEIKCGIVKLGRVENPFEVLLKTNIFVSLIEPDNYPSQSVMEAMDSCNALLLSDTGFSREFIDNNGLLTKLTVDDVVLNLDTLMNDRNMLNQYSIISSTVLNKKFNSVIFTTFLSTINKKLLNCYYAN
jgi:glycosyltransferase involved in cell wall biosynthesis